MKYLLSSILVLTLSFTSCKEHCPEEHDGDVQRAEAILQWYGSYAVDGCGYILRINEETLKITNEEEIDVSFQGNSVPVVISFTTQESQPFYCGDNPEATFYDMVQMVSLEKK